MHHEIGAAEPEGIYLEPPGLIRRSGPGLGLRKHLEAPTFHVDLGIGGAIVQGGGVNPVLQGHDAPDQAIDARGPQAVADLGLEGTEHHPPAVSIKALEGADFLQVPLDGGGGVAFHQVHHFRAVIGLLKTGANGDLLGLGDTLHHTPVVIAGADPGDVRIDPGAALFGHRFPLNDDHAAALPQDKPVPGGVEGAAAGLRGAREPGNPGQGPQGRKLYEVSREEVFFPAAHHRRVQDAVVDHLDGAVNGHQAGGASGGDRVARTHEAEFVADETAGGAVEPSQERGVVYGDIAGLDLLHRRQGHLRG